MRYNILVIDDNKDFSGSIKDDKILLKKHLRKELLTGENNSSEISIQNYQQFVNCVHFR